MKRSGEKLHIGMFMLAQGHHLMAWRLPESRADAWTDFRHYKRLAQTAERGLFDAIFVADADAMWSPDLAAMSRDSGALFPEPFTLLSAIAAVTDHIGLIVTASTTYNAPYHLARKLASLDWISGGRARWNIVTSSVAHARGNFGRDGVLDHDRRYEQAEEYVSVVKALWDAWDENTLVMDKQTGQYFNPESLHPVTHHGEFLRFERAVPNIPRPPQGWPVLVQAGSSNPGKDLAAGTADIVFTVQTTRDLARAFYGDIKARAQAAGRDPAAVKVMPGLFPVIGDTREAAEAAFARLQAFVDPKDGLSTLKGYGMDLDMTGHSWDDPFPDLPPTDGQQYRREIVLKLARERNLTIGEVCRLVAVTRGHNLVIGTAQDVADVMEDWFCERAADGFNLMLPVMPEMLDRFVEGVVPELQSRGLFRSAYEGGSFRSILGLAPPASPRAVAR